jgi:hypothetical protein
MLRSIKLGAVMAMVAGLSAGVGFGASAAFGSAAPAPHGAGVVGAAAVSARPELKYTAVAPCVLVDTRKAGGPLGNGTARDYHARGTGSLASQGGSATGCDIPNDATVIVVNVGSLSPVNAGFIKAKAFGSSGPGAGAVNYAARQNIGGVLNLNLPGPGAAKAFTLINTGGPTGVIVTVTGYFIAPITAKVDANGSVISTSRIATVTHPATGTYVLTADRDVSNCAFAVTPLFSINPTMSAVASGADITVSAYSPPTSDPRNASFSLVVTC